MLVDGTKIKKFAFEIRLETVRAIGKKGGGHIGGSLSIADLLAVLYGEVMNIRPNQPDWQDRDYFVCSKGHAGPAVYSALALKGFFPMDWLDELNTGGTKLPGHCDRSKVPGIDATTGSLGQGLSIACGIAHGLKIQHKKTQYVFCIMGDGEQNEGQIWEAAMYSAHHKLNNLICFIDWNKKQIDGTNDKVMKLGDLSSKYREFGWNSQIVDGHDIELIFKTIQLMKANTENPAIIILDTKKGAGVPCIEEMENNHCIGMPPTLYNTCIEQMLSENGGAR